jgi:hypothetical protein
MAIAPSSNWRVLVGGSVLRGKRMIVSASANFFDLAQRFIMKGVALSNAANEQVATVTP